MADEKFDVWKVWWIWLLAGIFLTFAAITTLPPLRNMVINWGDSDPAGHGHALKRFRMVNGLKNRRVWNVKVYAAQDNTAGSVASKRDPTIQDSSDGMSTGLAAESCWFEWFLDGEGVPYEGIHSVKVDLDVQMIDGDMGSLVTFEGKKVPVSGSGSENGAIDHFMVTVHHRATGGFFVDSMAFWLDEDTMDEQDFKCKAIRCAFNSDGTPANIYSGNTVNFTMLPGTWHPTLP